MPPVRRFPVGGNTTPPACSSFVPHSTEDPQTEDRGALANGIGAGVTAAAVRAAAAEAPGTPRTPFEGKAGLSEFATARAAWEASWKELVDKMNEGGKTWEEKRADYIIKVTQIRQCWLMTSGAQIECTGMYSRHYVVSCCQDVFKFNLRH